MICQVLAEQLVNCPRRLTAKLRWPVVVRALGTINSRWSHDDLESGVRVTCDVGYICANFSLPRVSLFST